MITRPVDRLLDALRAAGHEPRRTASGWECTCPAHDDRRPSLSISQGSDGRALVYCHAGCPPEAVVAELSLTLRDLMSGESAAPPPTAAGDHGRAERRFRTPAAAAAELERRLGAPKSALWTYRTATGEPVGIVVRFDRSDGKVYRPASTAPDGWWTLRGMPAPRPLYRLPDLDGEPRVYVVEGEKCADAAAGIGLIATTSAHGAGSAAKTDWTPLAGREVVILIEQSRLTRGDQLETALLFRELQERGTKIIVHSAVRSLDTVDERFVIGVQSLVDRAESERIRERMKRGKRARAERGQKNCGPAPFGYRNPPPGDPDRGKLQIVPEEAVVVRRIFDMAVKGYGEKRIAQVLNETGVASPRGGRWGGTTVRRVLHCMAYVGTSAANVWIAQKGSRTFRFEPGNPKAIIRENAHEPIIDRAQWDALHGRGKAPRTAVPRQLCGLLWVNGHPAHGDSERGARMYRGPRGVKDLPWLPVDMVEETVWNAFVGLAAGEDLVAKLMQEAGNPREAVLLGQEIDHAGELLGRAKRKLESLLDLVTDGVIDRPTYLRKRGETEEAAARLTAELASLRARAAVRDGTMAARVVRAVQTLLAGRTRLTGEQKRGILRSIVRRVDIEASRTGSGFHRDERGRVVQGKVERWRIDRVNFQLAVTVGDDGGAAPPRGAGGDAGAAPGRSAAPARQTPASGDGREARAGQLRTTL